MGVFEFRVCSIDSNTNQDATQNCLDLNLLKITNGSSTQYHIERTYTTIHINVSLPATLTCKHCVFQWRYLTGNSWGTSQNRSCIGCGKENEQFYGCSDISILNPIESIIDPSSTTKKSTITHRYCTSAITFSRSFDLTALMGRYYQTICSTNCAMEKSVMDNNNCLNSCDKLCLCQ